MLRRMRRFPQCPPSSMKGSRAQVIWARDICKKLLENHIHIRETCDVLALLTDTLDGAHLCEWYFDHLLRHQHRAVWWIEHRHDLSCVWFIQEYMRRYLHASPEATECAVCLAQNEALLIPEKPLYAGAVTLSVEKDSLKPDVGLCVMRYETHPVFSVLAREMGMTFNAMRSRYERAVNPDSGPLEERAAEMGARLLLAGFSVLIYDEALRARVCSGDFGWESGRWVDVSGDANYLRLYFSHDKRLFALARSMGAFWNGKHIEIGVWHVHEIRDFAKLYSFRITEAASSLMDQWQTLFLRGKVVNPASPPTDSSAGDPLEGILESGDAILEDLIDDD